MRTLLTALIALTLVALPSEARDWEHHHKKSDPRAKYKRVSPKLLKERNYFRFTYSDKSQFRDLDLPNADLVNFTFGRHHPGHYRLGSYIHFGTNFIDADDYDNYPTTRGRWRILSAGGSVTLWPGVKFYGGPGWAWSEALDIDCEGCDAEEADEGDSEHDELNWHAGLDYSLGKILGLSVEYDSAPDAVSIGFSLWFD